MAWAAIGWELDPIGGRKPEARSQEPRARKSEVRSRESEAVSVAGRSSLVAGRWYGEGAGNRCRIEGANASFIGRVNPPLQGAADVDGGVGGNDPGSRKQEAGSRRPEAESILGVDETGP
jgi:hypothetical protein